MGSPVTRRAAPLRNAGPRGAQAGLSWSTILRKRDGYRRAFAGFDPDSVARFGADDVARLMADPGIVRNRLKVESAIANARAVLVLRAAGESLADLLWGFVNGVALDQRPPTLGDVPAETVDSRLMTATSSGAASASSARRSATRSCRQRGSSTIT